MPFVKLDCAMLDSTVYIDRDVRDVFITSLLMAIPWELDEPAPAFEVDSLDRSGLVIPAGWYGFVQASGPGIVRRAGMEQGPGMTALRALCAPEPESRSHDFEGRRMARIDGGYILLNYAKYRERDYGGAERARRYRERLKGTGDDVTRDGVTVTRDKRNARVGPSRVTPYRTHAEAEAEAEAERIGNTTAAKRPSRTATEPEFEEFKAAYPKRGGGQPWPRALKAIHARIRDGHTWRELIDGARRYAAFVRATGKERTEFVMQAATFCGPDKRFLESWDLPASRAEAQQDANVEAGREWLRRQGAGA